MVKKSAKCLDPCKTTPNATLESSWDLLAEIWVAYRELGDRVQIGWVKGHQDNETPYEDLSLKAQLNVDADQLADQFIQDHPDLQYHQGPLLPTSGIQFNLPSGTVTSKLKRSIRWAKTEGPLTTHLCHKFDWTEAIFDDINWEAYRVAMNHLDKYRNTLNKHSCDWVRVGTRVHRDDPKYPKNCPSCPAEEETAPHLLLCPARKEWRTQFVQALHEFFKTWKTPLELEELLLEGVASVFEERDPDTVVHAQSVSHIAQAQAAIGWMEIFRGRLSGLWGIHQQEFLGYPVDKKINGQTWSTALAKLFLEQWRLAWMARNGDRHGRDKESRASAERKQALREVELLYEYKGFVEPKFNWILNLPLEQRKENRTYVLRAWISSFGPILKQSHEYQTRLDTCSSSFQNPSNFRNKYFDSLY